jgi:hypothetical protein
MAPSMVQLIVTACIVAVDQHQAVIRSRKMIA